MVIHQYHGVRNIYEVQAMVSDDDDDSIDVVDPRTTIPDFWIVHIRPITSDAGGFILDSDTGTEWGTEEEARIEALELALKEFSDNTTA